MTGEVTSLTQNYKLTFEDTGLITWGLTALQTAVNNLQNQR